MASEKTLKKLKQFEVQYVSGLYMALYRIGELKQIENKTLRNFMSAEYLNYCYHSFHKKTDEYVVNSLDKILKCGAIKNSICLFHWIFQIGESIMTSLDNKSLANEISEIKDVDKVRDVIHSTIMACYKLISSIIDINCSGDCSEKYDGTDLFVMKKV